MNVSFTSFILRTEKSRHCIKSISNWRMSKWSTCNPHGIRQNSIFSEEKNRWVKSWKNCPKISFPSILLEFRLFKCCCYKIAFHSKSIRNNLFKTSKLEAIVSFLSFVRKKNEFVLTIKSAKCSIVERIELATFQHIESIRSESSVARACRMFCKYLTNCPYLNNQQVICQIFVEHWIEMNDEVSLLYAENVYFVEDELVLYSHLRNRCRFAVQTKQSAWKDCAWSATFEIQYMCAFGIRSLDFSKGLFVNKYANFSKRIVEKMKTFSFLICRWLGEQFARSF